MTIILHNPNSPLSRSAVADLTDHEGVEIIDVVESTPDDRDLDTLLTRVPVAARDLLDRMASLYATLGLDDARWSEAEVMAAAFDNPSLLRCPILIAEDAVRVEDEALARVAERGADNDNAGGPIFADHG